MEFKNNMLFIPVCTIAKFISLIRYVANGTEGL